MSVSFAPNIEKAFDALQLWVAETQARVEELEREVFLLQQDTHIATREGDTPEVRRKALADAEAALRVREEVLGRRTDSQVIGDAVEAASVADAVTFEAAAIRTRVQQEAKRRRRDD